MSRPLYALECSARSRQAPGARASTRSVAAGAVRRRDPGPANHHFVLPLLPTSRDRLRGVEGSMVDDVDLA